MQTRAGVWHTPCVLLPACSAHAFQERDPGNTPPSPLPPPLSLLPYPRSTGKYLNVIRECGQHAPKPPPPPAWAPGTGGASAPTNRVQFDPHGAYAQQIAAAHSHAR